MATIYRCPGANPNSMHEDIKTPAMHQAGPVKPECDPPSKAEEHVLSTSSCAHVVKNVQTTLALAFKELLGQAAREGHPHPLLIYASSIARRRVGFAHLF